MTILVVRVHAPATRRPASMDMDARLPKALLRRVRPNVVFGAMPVQIGLIETIGGARLERLAGRFLERFHSSM
jgi:hypothetical protein